MASILADNCLIWTWKCFTKASIPMVGDAVQGISENKRLITANTTRMGNKKARVLPLPGKQPQGNKGKL